MITIDAIFVTTVIGVLIPVLVGLLTKLKASSTLKAVLNIVLGAIQSLIVSSMIDGGGALISKNTFILWVLSLIVSVASYVGVYKPTGISSKLFPNSGLGSAPDSAPTEVPPTTSARADLPA